MSTFERSPLIEAAARVAGGQDHPAGTLYVVATPSGNLADISLRAVHVLGLVDSVACEDTRHSGALLRHLGLEKPLLALHMHNEREAAETVVGRLALGARVADVSDAGTPGISDPGARLVDAVRVAGYRAVPVPGASSVVTALSVAGVVQDGGFWFEGFLPSAAKERERALSRCAAAASTQVLFEAPHRMAALVQALAQACPQRQVTVCRELTKQFETVHTLLAAEAPGWLAAQTHGVRGEFVVVLHAVPEAVEAEVGMHDVMLTTLLKHLSLKQAVAVAAELSGAARNELYARALSLKGT